MRVFIFVLSLLLTFSSAYSSVTLVPFNMKDKTVDDFPSVGSLENINSRSCGSGTVIDDGSFVITARHMVTHDGSANGMILDSSNFTFTVAGRVFKIEKVYGHPRGDIAILKLEGKFDKPSKLHKGNDLLNKVFYGAGFGRSSSTATANRIEWDLPYGTKRIFKNRVDDIISNALVINDTLIIEAVISFTAHDPCDPKAIEGEGMHGPGDSGGGCFIEQDNELQLIGVVGSITVNSPYHGYLARVCDYLVWAEEIMHPKTTPQGIIKTSVLDSAKPYQADMGLWGILAIWDRKRFPKLEYLQVL